MILKYFGGLTEKDILGKSNLLWKVLREISYASHSQVISLDFQPGPYNVPESSPCLQCYFAPLLRL